MSDFRAMFSLCCPAEAGSGMAQGFARFGRYERCVSSDTTRFEFVRIDCHY